MTKTSVVLMLANGGVRRGCLPTEVSEAEITKLRSAEGYALPVFQPARDETFTPGGYLDLGTGALVLKHGQRQTQHYNDRVSFANFTFDLTGVKLETKRWKDHTALYVLPDRLVAEVDVLDQKIAELAAQRTALLKLAATAGRPVRRWDCVQPAPKPLPSAKVAVK